MTDDDIRQHIEAAAGRHASDGRGLTSRMLRACWPGGPEDHTEPFARGWLSRWRPARAAATLPVCSCASGRCSVCN